MKKYEARLEFVLTKEEKELFREKADFLDISVGEFLRHVGKYGAAIRIDYSALGEYSYQLAQIGNNLNQVAKGIRFLNKTGIDIDEEMIKNEIIDIKDNLKNMNELVTKIYENSRHISYSNFDEQFDEDENNGNSNEDS